ncbi:MAG: hemerythrin domain-containing protein [Firmicutes bacterium]|jgi:hemerythrin-like domain-containing protein|nr:hemerythrin domain-containing protein [Bacillota bacterium]
MNKLNQLKKQHGDIIELLNETKGMINKIDDSSVQMKIAKNISKLAGILKIHLMSEDRNLYPAFTKSSNTDLQNKAKKYIDEMGDLSSIYMDFKDKYNTQSKINNSLSQFKSEVAKVFSAIETRIKKEDTDLYVLAEKLQV